MKEMKVSGKSIRSAVLRSAYTKEQVVASVQDKGLSFSLAGLDKVYRGELPKKDTSEILKAIADKLGCTTQDFAQSKSKSA